MKKIIDQQTDKSRSVLYALSGNMDNEELAKHAREDCSGDYTSLPSSKFACEALRLFPVNSAADTIASTLYFEDQKNSLPPKLASETERRLAIFRNLYDVPDELVTQTKVAEEEVPAPAHTLIPSAGLVKVASTDDMRRAADLFVSEHTNLPLDERVEFSHNFVKLAQEYGIDTIPTTILKYAGELDTCLSTTRTLLSYRAALANMHGVKDPGFRKLAEELGSVDTAASKADSIKLANVIADLDKAAGFTSRRYDTAFPDAWGSVFVKSAEAADTLKNKDKTVSDMDHADIVAKLGIDALDAVVKEDDTIDQKKLEHLLKVRDTYAG